jgi:hypothetical protein
MKKMIGVLVGVCIPYITLAVLAAQIEDADPEAVVDLGVVSPKNAITLHRNSTRSDFSHFVLEFLPRAVDTNQASFGVTKFNFTNDLVQVSDLRALPSGPILMGLHSVYQDGSHSALSLYKFELWRAAPPTPYARTIQVLEGSVSEPETIKEALDRRSSRSPVVYPPLPGSQRDSRSHWEGPIPPAEFWPSRTNQPSRALPGGKNKTYSEFQDEMADHYNRPGRRNER